MDKNLNFIKEFAKEINKINGRVFFVGGYVRDIILHKENKDVDIEVYGVDENTIEKILKTFGELDYIGKSFGIYKVHGFDVDIALPRKEVATGKGHRDFEVVTDPYTTFYEASVRRDLTINAILQDVITGEFVDLFNGIKDLENGVIRHINDETFVQDPLRVLRVAQFYARFDNFTVAEETKELCKTVNISYLSAERIAEELSKALLKSSKPSKFFNFLREINQLDYWFKPVSDLIGVKQSPKWHPEGDAYNHTMIVLDNVRENDLALKLAALCHDFGKAVSTVEDENGKISSIGHEITGVPIVKDFLTGIFRNTKLTKEVCELVRCHMTPHHLNANSKKSSVMRMFDDCKISDKEKLILISFYDSTSPDENKKKWFENMLDEYNRLGQVEEVNGDDLISLGLKPNRDFKTFLNFTHNLWLSGVSKDLAIKQLKGQFNI